MLRIFRRINRKAKKMRSTGPRQAPRPEYFKEISNRLEDNEAYLRKEFANISDIVFRTFSVGEIKILAVWFNGMVSDRLSPDLFHALMLDMPREQLQETPVRDLADLLNQRFLPFYTTARVLDLVEIKHHILMAKAVVLVQGCPVGLMLNAERIPTRAISEPVIESSVIGPHDAFVENIQVNTALIRSRLGDPQLKSEDFILGRRTNTLVTLMYLEDVANPKIVEEARRRISRIDIDGVLDSSYVKELIQDKAYSLFPLLKGTERPDKVVADLLEGRFALIVDGSPQVLLAPVLFAEFMQAADDYYLNPIPVLFVRLLRHLALFVATNLPGIYVAITTFHQEMIPIPLVFTIAGSREIVPFPTYIDAMFLLIIFELLLEASIRLPRLIGAAINIVGALILGQAAVQSSLVSPVLVIVIASTAISNFALGAGYELAQAVRVIRLAILAAGAALGFYGIALTSLAFLIHMAGLRSFGVPYMAPWAPIRTKEMKDVVFRAPRWDMTERPALITGEDTTRGGTSRPSPPPAQSRASNSDKGKRTSRRGGR